MTTMLKIWGKELKTYFNSPVLYIFLIVFCILSGGSLFYLSPFFEDRFATLAAFFGYLPMIFLVFVPAIAMRLWAEENKAGTLELLMTLPIRDWEAVVGKYLAALTILALALVLTFPIPYIVHSLVAPGPGGKAVMDFGPIYGGYAGIFLMGSVFLAVSSAVSATTRNQIIAFILGLVACMFFFFIGHPYILGLLPERLVPFFEYVGLAGHMGSITIGVFSTRTMLYFLSMVAFLLFVNVRIVESRRWR